MKWGLANTKKASERGTLSLRNNLDRVFDDFFSFRPSALFDSEWLPKLDLKEDEKLFKVEAEVPGIEEKDLNVTIDGNILTISGERRCENEEKNGKVIMSERCYGSFSRSLRLPEAVKTDKVSAVFKNGVLKLEIPKDESKLPKKIKVNVQ